MNELENAVPLAPNVMLLLQLLIMALSAACFLYIGYTAMTHFAVRGPLPIAMRCVVVLSVASFVGFNLVRPVNEASWASLLIYVLAFLLLNSSKRQSEPGELDLIFVNETPVTVVRRGPYKVIRHPIYASYILYWLANAIATGHWTQWASLGVLTLIYIIAAKREERAFLRSHLSEIYQVYRDSTWMFVPYVY